MAVPPPSSLAAAFFSYDQLRRSWYMFFFQHPLAEMAVPLDDLAFIDRLWADWSPGYDARDDLPRVKDALRDPANLAAAIGYYRATLGGVGLSDSPEVQAIDAAVNGPVPVPTLYLHGRDDGCMGADLVGGRGGRADRPGVAGRGGRRHRPLPPRGAARRGEPAGPGLPGLRRRVDERERQSRDAKRRHLERMLHRGDGFHEVSRGRAGTIYYREGEHVLALEWEMNAVEPGIILYLHGLRGVGAPRARAHLGRRSRAPARRARPLCRALPRHRQVRRGLAAAVTGSSG